MQKNARIWNANNPNFYGWVNDQKQVDKILAGMQYPSLRDRPEYRDLANVSASTGFDVMPWLLEENYLGGRLNAHYQKRGTCVSQAWARGVQFAILEDIARGDAEEWKAEVLPASIYGASRVEIGGGRIRGDGSIGAWAAKAVTQYGVLFKLRYGNRDFTKDTDELHAIEWGNRGVPDELEPKMREHPVTEAALCDNVEDWLICCDNRKPVPVCSGRGFTTQRDQYGFCYASGKWAHCMLFYGKLLVKHPRHSSGKEGALCWQSWGNNSPSGNDRVTLQTGEEITLPKGTFLVELETLDKMLRARDSFAIAGIKGFEVQPNDFNWFTEIT